MNDFDDFVSAHRQYLWYKHYGAWHRATIEIGDDGPFFRRKRSPWPSYAQAEALCHMMPCCYRLTDDAAYRPDKERESE